MSLAPSTEMEALHHDLLDIQYNLNAVIQQLDSRQPAASRTEGTAALMAAMGYKLTQLSRTLQH